MSTEKRKIESTAKVPVTLLSGFLGAGKSTLLRHILETKHSENGDFKCAVIVNDMAELNIDKSLIESTGLVQTDEIVSMQNGCVCCSLSGDLVNQIKKLTQAAHKFDYMIIEASGVSEPAAIAALFEECEEDHDHSSHQDDSNLSQVATMDTLVTVVDSAEFLQNLNAIANPDKEKFPQLLVDQIEYANLILLNKTDLVGEDQLTQIEEHVKLLNSKAKLIQCRNANVDVMQVLNTGLFQANDFDLEAYMTRFNNDDDRPKSCCKAAMAKGESPCCLRARTVDSGKSKVLLPSKKNKKTRHGEKYKITSFVYKARRPFHSSKLHEAFFSKYFMFSDDDDDDGDGESDEEDEDNERAKEASETEAEPQPKPKDGEAIRKGVKAKAARTEVMGSLLRIKGYMWVAGSHDLVGYVSIAGNIASIATLGPWNALKTETWTGSDAEKAVLRKDWVDPWGDRRQELVFIGQDLKHKAIQEILDSCLLSDAEMAMGPDGWKATMGDVLDQE